MHEFRPEICLIAEPKQKTEHLDFTTSYKSKGMVSLFMYKRIQI